MTLTLAPFYLIFYPAFSGRCADLWHDERRRVRAPLSRPGGILLQRSSRAEHRQPDTDRGTADGYAKVQPVHGRRGAEHDQDKGRDRTAEPFLQRVRTTVGVKRPDARQATLGQGWT